MTVTLNAEKHRPSMLGQHQVNRTTVLNRLHGLFPTPSPTTSPATNVPNSPETAVPSPSHVKPLVSSRKALKIRMLTWNMHDSLPKGDLEELLGKVPLWEQGKLTPGLFPNLPLEAVHPYHLVVVAAQECPSLSGIPMGFGAGFKLGDKDKDHVQDGEKTGERYRMYDKPRPGHKNKEGSDFTRSHKRPEESQEPPSGWTSMVEGWLCHGTGSVRTGSPTVSDVGFPKPLAPRLSPKEPRKGPYQLLVKERMMGIYLAVYIHRDLRPLVRGTSRSAVTAGLIGGRVGNKGGVGITVNLDGTTFLFLNAHLAAHEGKINHRLSNLTKIKSELTVDDFLAHDDPRVMAEDITDKFDYTFLCGDLNFRLDISRLHADWLITNKEYAQALAFDQLTRLMGSGEAFVGFKEASINFAPTFKYDVLRTIKHTKRGASRFDHGNHSGDRSHLMIETGKKELEVLETGEADDGETDEGASLASSIWTSMHSRQDTDRDPGEDQPFTYPSAQTMTTSASKASVALTAAQKAKVKWLALIRPLSSKSRNEQWKVEQSKEPFRRKKIYISNTSVDITSDGHLAPPIAAGRASPDTTDQLRPQPPLILINSTKSSLRSEEGDDPDDKGVYDSSHKQRVPSWCDRILWKSTIEPDPEPEEDVSAPPVRARNRMGQFFASAFRPLSARTRRDSSASIATFAASDLHEARLFKAYEDTKRLSYSVQQPRASLDEPKHIDFSSKTETASTADCHPSLHLQHSPMSSPVPPIPESTATHRAVISTGAPPSPPAITASHIQTPVSSRWRFLTFLSHNSTQSNSMDLPLDADIASDSAPRKGDVLCLSYDTLDDQGMRRLEGRSDHRPVVGSYIIYL